MALSPTSTIDKKSHIHDDGQSAAVGVISRYAGAHGGLRDLAHNRLVRT